MKKSEMMEIIYGALCKPVGNHDDGGTQMAWQTEHIMKAIEDAGMLPPLNDDEYQHMANEDRRLNTFFKLFHSWEAEDEA